MPPKIALMIHAMNGGGAERLMSQLAARWSQQSRVCLITWATVDTDTYPLPAAVERIGLGLMRPSPNPLAGLYANWQRVRRLRQALKLIEPDFMLSFSDQMNIVALEATRAIPAPHWISEHSDPAQQRLNPMWEAWRHRTYPRCDGCVALTAGIADYMARWVPRHKISVIPPAVDLPEEMRMPAVRMHSGDSSLRTILYVGRLSREKGADLLLDAWRRIAAQLPGWQLTIAGDGPLRPELEAMASELPRVKFLGWVTEPWKLYATAEVFVLPSRYEGFPVALLEAMRCGRAAVATRCSSAIVELLEADPGCLVDVPCLQPEALATALVQLAHDVQGRTRLGVAAGRVAKNYSWGAIGPRWDALLDACTRGS